MSPKSPVQSLQVPGVGVSGVSLPAMAMITTSDISQRISEVIRNIVTSVFEILQPVLTVLGVAQILLGLMLAMGLRQEFLGYRLIVSGLLTLVFVYIIAPFLLQFI
jgi:ABC-type uncharacterized transport system fused permease/ATPase subunit